MKKPRPLEREVLKVIRDYLRLTGWLTIRLNSGSVVGEYKGRRRLVRFNDMPGCADLLAVKHVALFVEVKRPGGKTSKDQDAFLEDVRRHGGLGFVVDGLDSLKQQLEEHGL